MGIEGGAGLKARSKVGKAILREGTDTRNVTAQMKVKGIQFQTNGTCATGAIICVDPTFTWF